MKEFELMSQHPGNMINLSNLQRRSQMDRLEARGCENDKIYLNICAYLCYVFY